MITTCTSTPEIAARVCDYLGLDVAPPVAEWELEFREVPYFIVSRSRERWEIDQGDINTACIVGVNERGLVLDPESGKPERYTSGKQKETLIPWTNIISLTVTRQ